MLLNTLPSEKSSIRVLAMGPANWMSRTVQIVTALGKVPMKSSCGRRFSAEFRLIIQLLQSSGSVEKDC